MPIGRFEVWIPSECGFVHRLRKPIRLRVVGGSSCVLRPHDDVVVNECVYKVIQKVAVVRNGTVKSLGN